MDIGNHQYSLVRFISAGMDGKVFLMEDELGRKRAIKLLFVYHDEPLDPEYFSVQRIIKTINHPNIVRYYDEGEISPSSHSYRQTYFLLMEDELVPTDEDIAIPYVVMEYIEGQAIDNEAVSDPLKLVREILSALLILHEHEISHNDLNFYNILYDQEGDRYVVIDFSLSRFNSYNDMRHVADNLFAVLWYPDEGIYVDQSLKSHYTMLPNDSLINKFANYLVSLPDTNQYPISHYISVLSILFGTIEINLEGDNQVQEWNCGVAGNIVTIDY